MIEDARENLFIRHAQKDDMEGVVEIIEMLRLDDQKIKRGQFVVAKHITGVVAGCARLRPLGYDFYELASVGVHPEFQGLKIGANLVAVLLQLHPACKPTVEKLRGVWAICNKLDYNFFAMHGFLPCMEYFWPKALDQKVEYCGEKYKDETLIVVHYGNLTP